MEESSMHKRKINFTNLTTFFIISFSNSDLFIRLTFEKNKTKALWWPNSNKRRQRNIKLENINFSKWRHQNSPLLWKNNSSWKQNRQNILLLKNPIIKNIFCRQNPRWPPMIKNIPKSTMPIIHPEKIYSSWKNIHHSIFSAKNFSTKILPFWILAPILAPFLF